MYGHQEQSARGKGRGRATDTPLSPSLRPGSMEPQQKQQRTSVGSVAEEKQKRSPRLTGKGRARPGRRPEQQLYVPRALRNKETAECAAEERPTLTSDKTRQQASDVDRQPSRDADRHSASDADRHSASDTGRHLAICEDQQAVDDMNTQAASVEEKQPAMEVHIQPADDEASQPSCDVDRQQSAIADGRPTTDVDRLQSDDAVSWPATDADSQPASGDERKPSIGVSSQSACDVDSQPVNDEERRAASEEEKWPASGEEEKWPASGEEEKWPASGEEEKWPANGEEEKWPASGEEEKRPASGEEGKRPASDGEEKQPASDEEEKQPASDEKRQPTSETDSSKSVHCETTVVSTEPAGKTGITHIELPDSKNTRGKQGSEEEEEDDCSWDKMFDENGDLVDTSMMEELTSFVGKVDIREPQETINYLSYSPKETNLEMSEYGHVIEISDFPVAFQTADLMSAFKEYMNRGFDIKWVDDTHALGVFSSTIAANDALKMIHPMMKLKPMSEASKQSRLKAKRCEEFLQPYKPRPQTSAAAARRLVTGALGLAPPRVPKEQRDAERKVLKEAREKKRKDRKRKDDIWNGNIGTCAMDNY